MLSSKMAFILCSDFYFTVFLPYFWSGKLKTSNSSVLNFWNVPPWDLPTPEAQNESEKRLTALVHWEHLWISYNMYKLLFNHNMIHVQSSAHTIFSSRVYNISEHVSSHHSAVFGFRIASIGKKNLIQSIPDFYYGKSTIVAL